MQIDVVTLFPQWFDWFHEPAPRRQRAAAGSELRTLNPREHTPLSGGQVDDTPFGGGAGMVLRVDVMDHALRGFYNVDPVDLRQERRVIALTPGRPDARRRVRRRARGRARDDAALRPLRGLRRAHRRSTSAATRSRSGATCWPAASSPRWCSATPCCASSRARSGHADSAGEESFSSALGGDPEYPHYTRPAEYRGWTRARGAALGPPRGDPPLAPRAQPRARRGDELTRSGAPRRAGTHSLSSLARADGRPPWPRARLVGRPDPRAPSFAMSTVIDNLERAQLRRVPNFAPGDRVKVHFQVVEGTRRRTQVFEGVVLKRQGHGARETFTVRKQSFGVGVERTFPVHSPKIERIEVAARGDVRRAKLYYLRDRVGKRARVRERRYIGPEEIIEPGLLHQAELMAAEADAQEIAAQEGEDAAVVAEARGHGRGSRGAGGDRRRADAEAGPPPRRRRTSPLRSPPPRPRRTATPPPTTSPPATTA